MSRVAGTLALLLALALVGPACASDERRKLPERVRVPGGALVLPTERCGDWFLVEATLDGEGPFRLMIDTGAEVCAVHEGVADALEGRRLKRYGAARGSGGGRTAIDRWVRVDTLRAGEFEAGGFDVAVMDLHALTHSLGTRLDGVIGFGTFAGTVLTFDFPADEVRVDIGELPAPDGDTVFGLRSRTRPVVPLAVQDRVLPVLLDTGQRSAFAIDGSVHDELSFLRPPVVTGFSLGTDGRTRVRTGRLDDDVRFGRFTLERPVVTRSGKGSRIGTALLKRFVVSFDPLRRRVRLTRDEGDVVPAPPMRGLGCGFDPREDGWEIVELYEGSPLLDAGAAPGDVLVGLDGVSFPDLGCGRWTAFGEDGPVEVTLRRGDESRTAEVELATLVE